MNHKTVSRYSGSIISAQLLLSLTGCFRSASSFEKSEKVACWISIRPWWTLELLTELIKFKGRVSPHSFYSNIYKLISDLDWHRMDYETYETDHVYDSMERNPGVDEVCGVWIKIIIVEFVILLICNVSILLKTPKTSPQQTENGDSRKKAGII